MTKHNKDRRARPRAPSTWSLSRQIIVVVIGVSVLIGAIVGEAVRHFDSQHMLTELEDRTVEVVSLISAVAVDAMITEDVPLIETIIQQTITVMPDIRDMSVFNEDDNVIAHWRRDGVNHPLHHFTVSKAISFSGEQFGSMTVQWDLRNAQLQLDNHVLRVRLLVGGGFLALAIALIISF